MSHMIKTHHSEARASATLHHPDPSVNREENLDDAGEFSSLVDSGDHHAVIVMDLKATIGSTTMRQKGKGGI